MWHKNQFNCLLHYYKKVENKQRNSLAFVLELQICSLPSTKFAFGLGWEQKWNVMTLIWRGGNFSLLLTPLEEMPACSPFVGERQWGNSLQEGSAKLLHWKKIVLELRRPLKINWIELNTLLILSLEHSLCWMSKVETKDIQSVC